MVELLIGARRLHNGPRPRRGDVCVVAGLRNLAAPHPAAAIAGTTTRLERVAVHLRVKTLSPSQKPQVAQL